MITIDLLRGWQKMFTPKKLRRNKKKKKVKIMIRLTRAEIKFLKGFNGIELDRYLMQFPKRRKNTEEFKRRYKWVAGQWRNKL